MNYKIDLDYAEAEKIILHRVGNKSHDEGIRIAKDLLSISDGQKEALLKYFLKDFKNEKLYQLNHEFDLYCNPIFKLASRIFEFPFTFYDGSIEMLKHLYEKSNHVKIQGGELYVCYLKEVLYDDEVVDAIGIFKSEKKDIFLKLKLDEKEEWTVDFQEGTNTEKLDKGCIILNTEEDSGYRVLSVDMKSADASYWMDDFLSITEVKDENYHTRAYLELCKEFAKRKLKEIPVVESADFLNRCKDYFQHYKKLNEVEFKEMIFEKISDPEAWDKFMETKEQFMDAEKYDEDVETFIISKDAAKKASRSLRNTIKLDTGINIKIDSSAALDQEMIEYGYDEDREMKFYKIYYNNEKS